MDEAKQLLEMDEYLADYESRRLKGQLTEEELKQEKALEEDKKEFAKLFNQFFKDETN